MLFPPLVGRHGLSCSKDPVARELPFAAAVQDKLSSGRCTETRNFGVGGGHVGWEVRPCTLLQRVGGDHAGALLPLRGELMRLAELWWVAMETYSQSEAGRDTTRVSERVRECTLAPFCESLRELQLPSTGSAASAALAEPGDGNLD